MGIDFSGLEGLATGTEAPEEGKQYKRLEKNAKDVRNTEAIWREVAENIRTSEKLRREILLGAKSGLALDELYAMAIDCIVAMTGDTVFGKQAKESTQNK